MCARVQVSNLSPLVSFAVKHHKISNVMLRVGPSSQPSVTDPRSFPRWLF